MKKTIVCAIACLIVTMPILADDAADAAAAKAVVERAVKAAGWEKDPVDLKMTWKEKGSMALMGFKLEYTADWAYAGPDKYRFVMKAKVANQDFEITVVANGDKAWESGMGQVREITGEKLAYTLGEVYQFYVCSLAPLLKDPAFKLKPIADKDIDGAPAAGIEVTRQGKTAIKLFFDKKTGLFAKLETRVKDEFQNWKEVSDEAYFSDWKDDGGAKAFHKMKIVRDGKPLIESEFSDRKRHSTLDAKLFEKPAGK